MSSSSALPRPDRTPVPPGPQLEPVTPPPARKRKKWVAVGVVLVLIAIGGLIWSQREQLFGSRQAALGPGIRTATVYLGDLIRTLRTSGTIAAQNFAAIRAPRMRGGRESGRSQLTLMNLAEAGSVARPGQIVAEFEFKWLEDHIDDRRSTLTQTESDVDKRRAEIMIEKETQQQLLRTARAERDKAALDLRTAEVRSEIEAEKLKLALEEAEATVEQLEEETRLQEISHAAELRSLELQIEKDRLHLERHLRDVEKIKTATPVGGLIVMESIYKGRGQFDQVTTGDEVNPGTYFMRVVDLSQMVVEGSVNQVDSQAVRMGQRAEVRLDAYPDLVLPGRVVSLGAMATSGGGGFRWGRGMRDDWVKQVPIEVLIEDQDDRVIPDLSASADIVLANKEGQLLMPLAAVREKNGSTVVLVRQRNSFVEREVELGEDNGVEVIVRAGLQEGDEVALEDLPRT